MAEPQTNLNPRINPTTPERQVAAFGVELDKLLYRFGCEFDIEPEDYAATLMTAAEDILLHEMEEPPGFTVRIMDGPVAGEVYELAYPPDYGNEPILFWQARGARYRLHRMPTGIWQGVEV